MFEADLYEDGGTELLEFDGPEGELEFEFEDEGEFGEEDDFELEGAFDTEGWEVGELEFEGGAGVDEEDFEDGSAEFEFDGYESMSEFESEESDEEFFGKIFKFAKKAFRGIGKFISKGARALGKVLGPIFKKLAPIAAKIVGGAIGGPAGAAIGGSIASAVLKEAELESEGETEMELARTEVELEGAGGDVADYLEMEYEAAKVARTANRRTANRGILRMVMLAVRAYRKNRKLRPAIPRVVRGALALAGSLHKNAKTRWAVRLVPLIVVRTLNRLAKANRITPKVIVTAMARETAWVLANRKRAMAALRRHRMALARRRSSPRRRRMARRRRRRVPG